MSDALERMLTESPLVLFSPYTQGSIQNLSLLRQELRTIRPYQEENTAVVPDGARMHAFFWFWVLGAYEVARTLSQHKNCFAARKHDEIGSMKKRLAKIRMPFAKQELEGERTWKHPTAFYSENSISGISLEKGMLFRVKDEEYWSDELMNEFDAFIGSFTQHDIIEQMPNDQNTNKP